MKVARSGMLAEGGGDTVAMATQCATRPVLSPPERAHTLNLPPLPPGLKRCLSSVAHKRLGWDQRKTNPLWQLSLLHVLAPLGFPVLPLSPGGGSKLAPGHLAQQASAV